MHLRSVLILTAVPFALLSVWPFGCMPRPTGRPVWVVSREHRDFPPGKYLLGFGEATEQETAERNALEDLRGRLKIELGRAVQSAKAASPKEGPFSWFHPLSFGPRLETSSPKIVLRWQSSDGRRHAAIAALDRLQESGVLQEQLRAAEKNCAAAATEADRLLLEERNPYLSLRNFLLSLRARAEAEELRLYLGVIAGSPVPLPRSGPTDVELTGKLNGFLDGLGIHIVRGDGQRVAPEGGLPQPLVVSVRLALGNDPAPVHSLPLRFSTASGQLDRTARTGEFGLASVEVKKLPPPDRSENRITVRLDSQDILADAGIRADDVRFTGLAEILDRPRARFRFLKPGEAASRVVVLVKEVIAGEQAGTSVVGDLVSGMMSQEGFVVVDPESVFGSSIFPGSMEAAIRKAKGQVDVIVLGTVEAHVANTLADGFVFARVKGNLKAVAVDVGRVLTSHDQSTKGAGRDEVSALERALTAFARSAGPALLEAVRGLSGSGP